MAALSKYARRAGRHRGADAIRIGSCGRRLHDIAVSCNLNPRLVPVASCRLLGRTEAEILRKWGQTWKAGAGKAKSPLPAGTWAMPEIWTPAPRKPGWPPTGMIPGILPPHDLLPPPGRRGRPRRVR